MRLLPFLRTAPLTLLAIAAPLILCAHSPGAADGPRHRPGLGPILASRAFLAPWQLPLGARGDQPAGVAHIRHHGLRDGAGALRAAPQNVLDVIRTGGPGRAGLPLGPEDLLV